MQGLEPRPERFVRRRRRGKVLVYVGLAFMAIGAPTFVTQRAITVAMALGVLLVLIGHGWNGLPVQLWSCRRPHPNRIPTRRPGSPCGAGSMRGLLTSLSGVQRLRHVGRAPQELHHL
jgi:hypothetical protein